MTSRFFKLQHAMFSARHESEEEMLDDLNERLLKYMTMEHAARFRSVIALITEITKKLKVAFILPQILENYYHLKIYLTGTKYEILIKLIKDFLKGINKDPEDTYSRCSSMHNLIDYVNENYDLLEYLPEWLNELEPNDKRFVKYMDDIKAIAMNHFARRAFNKVDREDELNTLHDANEQIISELTYLENKLTQKRASLIWRSAAKLAVIMNMQNELNAFENAIRVQANFELSKLRNEYAKSPVEHINRMKELEENHQKVEQNFFKYKTQNIHAIKLAMDEKNKLLLQLQSLIKKYDEVMLEKFRERIELDEQLQEAKQQLNELLPTYNREEARHYELVVKKEVEEERIFQLILLKFIQNRAAKVIQRWYRKLFRAIKKVAAGKAKAKGTAKKKKKSIKK